MPSRPRGTTASYGTGDAARPSRRHTRTLVESGGLGHVADVGLGLLPGAVDLLGLVIGDCTGDDNIVALRPVDWCGHPVVGRQLERVDDPENLIEIAARRHRVDEDQLDL